MYILKVKLFPYWTHFGCIYLDGMFCLLWMSLGKFACNDDIEERMKERERKHNKAKGWTVGAHKSDVPFMRTIRSYTHSIRELKDFIIWGIDTVLKCLPNDRRKSAECGCIYYSISFNIYYVTKHIHTLCIFYTEWRCITYFSLMITQKELH